MGGWFLLEPDPRRDTHFPLYRKQSQHTEQQHKASQCIMVLAGAWVTLSSHTGFSGRKSSVPFSGRVPFPKRRSHQHKQPRSRVHYCHKTKMGWMEWYLHFPVGPNCKYVTEHPRNETNNSNSCMDQIPFLWNKILYWSSSSLYILVKNTWPCETSQLSLGSQPLPVQWNTRGGLLRTRQFCPSPRVAALDLISPWYWLLLFLIVSHSLITYLLCTYTDTRTDLHGGEGGLGLGGCGCQVLTTTLCSGAAAPRWGVPPATSSVVRAATLHLHWWMGTALLGKQLEGMPCSADTSPRVFFLSGRRENTLLEYWAFNKSVSDRINQHFPTKQKRSRSPAGGWAVVLPAPLPAVV